MEPFIGQISYFPWSWTIRDWQPCQGQLLPINNYQALFSLLGTNFGGDGRTNFKLPDLRKKDEAGNPIPFQSGDIVPHIAIQGYYPSRD